MTQRTLFKTTPRKPDENRRTNLPMPWRRVDGGQGKLGSTYQDGRGYTIQHCGHPTANWPYMLYGPDELMIMAPNGKCWQKSIYAAIEVDRLLQVKK